MCVCVIVFKIPPSFLFIWHGHTLERLQSAQNKYGSGPDLMLYHNPREISWVNYCHSLPSMFYGIWPTKNSQSDLDELNEYLYLKINSTKGSTNCLSCFTGWLVSVGTSLLGSFTHKPPRLPGASQDSLLKNIVTKD